MSLRFLLRLAQYRSCSSSAGRETLVLEFLILSAILLLFNTGNTAYSLVGFLSYKQQNLVLTNLREEGTWKIVSESQN